MSAEILEEGRVYFFYSPRVGETEVDDIEDVQRLRVVLRSRGTDRFRVLVIGRRRLPRHERLWATVLDVVEGADRLREVLGPGTYETRTRGRCEVPAACLAGEGVYVLARHGDHTHLAYELLHPQRAGDVQRELNLQRRASFIIMVCNPGVPSPLDAGAGTGRWPRFPDDLRARFGDRRFAPVDPPGFLDYEGTELVLIGVAGELARERIDLDSEAVRLSVGDVFEELRLSRDRQLADPLMKGSGGRPTAGTHAPRR